MIIAEEEPHTFDYKSPILIHKGIRPVTGRKSNQPESSELGNASMRLTPTVSQSAGHNTVSSTLAANWVIAPHSRSVEDLPSWDCLPMCARLSQPSFTTTTNRSRACSLREDAQLPTLLLHLCHNHLLIQRATTTPPAPPPLSVADRSPNMPW
ncbi:hypothetical protein V8E53_001516, partial [Lactarius tabidus]